MESDSSSWMAEKGMGLDPEGVNVNVPLSRSWSVVLAVKGPMLKVFVVVTVPPVVIKVTFVPTHVVPFKDEDPSAKALPAAEINRTNSPTMKILTVFLISRSS
jgi:hypothetical protein